VRLLVRSYDRLHALELRAKHVDYEIRETFESALLFGRKTLEALGASEEQALETVEDVRRRDEERLKPQASDGLQAGREHVFRKPVTPEPLVKPVREGKRLDTAA
jgi:CPA2 family monovalent cation:H+ antiporter-2